MVDRLSKEKRSELMSKIRSRDTKIEKVTHGPLTKMGFEYHPDNIKGKPDYAHREAMIAIFLNGCFFHGCPVHCNIPKTNTKFWVAKFERNKKRDVEVTAALIDAGWLVFRVWEHSVNDENGFAYMLNAIQKALKGRMGIDSIVGGVRYL